MVGIPPDEDCFSFSGRAAQWTYWVPGLIEFLSKIHHSTKNSSGVVVGGMLGCIHVNRKSAATTHESHLCNCHCSVHGPNSDSGGPFARQEPASIVYWYCPVPVPFGRGAHQVTPVPFGLRHPFKPSLMMRIGAAAGHLPSREVSPS